MAEEEQAWYYLVNGEQVGPISAEDLQQYAAGGAIHAETEVWTEGLDQWIPASHVEGLAFGQPEPAPQHTGRRLIVGAAAQAAHPLAGEVAQQFARPAPAPGAAQQATVQAQVGGLVQPTAAPGFGPMPAAQPGEDYPATGTKRASYGMLLGFLFGGIALIILGSVIGGSMASQGSEEQALTGSFVILGFAGIGGLMALVSSILTYVFLYRAWNCLRFGAPRTTPGKAIGFLFIPAFNIYWIFVALYGLAQDWNRVMGSHPNLRSAPRMSEGMILAYLICMLSGIGAPVGIVLWFIVFKQICDGVNFMAAQNMRQSRPAGLSFY